MISFGYQTGMDEKLGKIMSSVITKKIDKSLAALTVALEDREDFFFTTSFGYQSALMFYLACSIRTKPPCLCIKSRLASEGVEQQKDALCKMFAIDLVEINRDPWLDSQLTSRKFQSLHPLERNIICRELKRPILSQYIEDFGKGIWISGIRRDQTISREDIKFLTISEIGVIKISPLYDWTGSDVRDALKFLDLPTNADYFDLCKNNSSKECGLHY